MKPDRCKQAALLLMGRNEPHQAVKGLRLASQPGPAPSGRVPCGCGRVRNRSFGKNWEGATDCLSCGGTGFRKPQAVFGELGVESDEQGRVFDPYVFGADRDDRQRVTPSEKPREVDTSLEPFERRPRIWRLLDVALDALRIRDEQAWYYLTVAYCEGRYGFEDGEPIVGFRVGVYLTAGLRFVEVRLPDPIRLPGFLQEQYDVWEIERLKRQGRSIRGQAKEHGVDRRKIRKRIRAA